MIAGHVRRRLVADTPQRELLDYRLPSSRRGEFEEAYQGDLGRIFFGPKTRLVDKWLHYLEIYEHHFGAYRGKPLKFLEIGVFRGGSLEMWRSYFGDQAEICGVDIDPQCKAYETPGTRVRIGSQADPAFLKGVVAEFGAPDIILDDGSHVARHQEVSFKTLFPLLKEGGIYAIEDMHTAYWRQFGGGYRRKGSAIELVKDMIDDMHAWYHHRPTSTSAKTDIGGIHIYDSMVFIEKKRRTQPAYIRIPGSDEASKAAAAETEI
jgi:hypothetical protein